MANPEHLKVLRKGVVAWNDCRHDKARINPDLRTADLRRASLTGADLRGVDLRGADLRGADLRGVDLSGADLREANLMGANLMGANLSRANLSRANLSRADLSGAVLGYANLSKAKLYSTSLVNMDLSEVKGLDTVDHIGASSLGLDTFFLSKGKIPDVFLRGVGAPDVFIQYAQSLAGVPFEFYSCFISYSSKDDALAHRLHADLQGKGVRCWFGPEDIKIGDKFRVEIDEAVRIHDKLLLLLSENSVSSAWVEKEVEAAFEKEGKSNQTVLFPVRLDGAVMEVESGWPADVRRSRHIGDFSQWKDHDAYQKAFDRLLRDLKADTKPSDVKR